MFEEGIDIEVKHCELESLQLLLFLKHLEKVTLVFTPSPPIKMSFLFTHSKFDFFLRPPPFLHNVILFTDFFFEVFPYGVLLQNVRRIFDATLPSSARVKINFLAPLLLDLFDDFYSVGT